MHLSLSASHNNKCHNRRRNNIIVIILHSLLFVNSPRWNWSWFVVLGKHDGSLAATTTTTSTNRFICSGFNWMWHQTWRRWCLESRSTWSLFSIGLGTTVWNVITTYYNTSVLFVVVNIIGSNYITTTTTTTVMHCHYPRRFGTGRCHVSGTKSKFGIQPHLVVATILEGHDYRHSRVGLATQLPLFIIIVMG